MFRLIYQLATAADFRPFTIQLVSGTRYRVRSADEIRLVGDNTGNVVEDYFQLVSGGRVCYVAPAAIAIVELDRLAPEEDGDNITIQPEPEKNLPKRPSYPPAMEPACEAIRCRFFIPRYPFRLDAAAGITSLQYASC
jgi:hypothetical protein